MTDNQRRAFANLIFLCTPHHLFIDKMEPQNYPIDVLDRWKADRETGRLAQLHQQSNLTEEHLQEVIAGALEEKLKDVRNAIARVERIDSEAASLLRELADQMNAPALSSETVDTLYHAASILSPILEESNVSTLYYAARQLSEMRDMLEELPNSIEGLRRFRGDF